MRRLVLVAALLLSGCASQEYRVASAQNVYDFRKARYAESCVPASNKVWCQSVYSGLVSFEKHLHEASRALGFGGSIKLQLQALAADEKAVKEAK